jgi:hypothetical protein
MARQEQGMSSEGMMDKHVKRVLEKITWRLVEEYGSPYAINCGACEEWASAVLETLEDSPHAAGYWATDCDHACCGHVFVEIDGRFHDAECLEGVDGYMQLPLFAKWQRNHPGMAEPVQLENYNGAYRLKATRLGYTPEQLAEAVERDAACLPVRLYEASDNQEQPKER